MKKINFNKNWQFKFGADIDAFAAFGFGKYSEATSAAARFYPDNDWDSIDLPHDYAVNLPKNTLANTMAGGRANSHFARFFSEEHNDLDRVDNIGWYRKVFTLDKELADKRIFIEFEGVFRDSIVWVNGVYIDRHASGYTSFSYDITDHVFCGEENSIAVRVDSDQPEGWWYEGSGIYRNVFLVIGEPTYFKLDSTFIKSYTDGSVSASAILVNDTAKEVTKEILWQVLDAAGNITVEHSDTVTVGAFSEMTVSQDMRITSPVLWDLDNPYLYTMRIDATDVCEEKFGIRSVGFDKDRGFLLNGKPTQMRGACVHQDFGGVGIALSDNLNYYKIAKLKEMGINAYRASHNPPAPALLRACDELGMLVMDETRMFGTSPEAISQLESLVLRDRNHPSVVVWSIGNEEFSVQGLPFSAKLADKMQRILRTLDDTRPITFGGNNDLEFDGVNSAIEVRGVNYIHNGPNGHWLDEYHAAHPDQPIVGTEETSYVLSRGATFTDLGSGILECNGDVTMPWGSTAKGWLRYMDERPYFAGSYMWTGFDYRGEPNPYIYTNFSSSFGTIDLAGIPKPPFYYYRSWWTDEPVLKLAPHWNFKKGDTVPVVIYTNLDDVTLYLNDKELGKYKVERLDDIRVNVPFEAGQLRVEGIKDGVKYTDSLTTAGAPTNITKRVELLGKDDGDVSIVELAAVDKSGNLCPLASAKLEVSIPDGEIVGVCNGDPADTDPEQPTYHNEYRDIRTFIRGDGALYPVPPRAINRRQRRDDYIQRKECRDGNRDDFRNVAFYMFASDTGTETYTVTLSDISEYEFIEFERFSVDVEIFVGGKKIGDNFKSGRNTSTRYSRPYRFYTRFKKGENKIEVRATLNTDIREPFSGYVRLGRKVPDPMYVRLHYGLARVFVKSKNPDKLTAKFKKA